ncbi:MAG: DNA polymerase IV [Firmicutes bacterium]|nr:DNA polymerase IV [Bacillota bacterium]
MNKVILHSDINHFYAAVECLKKPELFRVPVAVCGDPALRHGVVLAKNMLAKAAGVKTGDTAGEAARKCPGIMLVKPDFPEYERLSNYIFNLYTRYSDRVEPYGPDECWIDASRTLSWTAPQSSDRANDADLRVGEAIANEIRREITAETGLTVSVGVSWNKTFAKMGSDLKKPDAVTVIDRQNYREKLYGLPVNELFMVGKQTAKRLKLLNLKTIGELAAAQDFVLLDNFGKFGATLLKYARGQDDAPVRYYYEGRKVESVGHGTTTKRDVVTLEDARAVLLSLADMVAKRLRDYSRVCTGVSVHLRDNALSSVSRQKHIPATNSGSDIARGCMELLVANYTPGVDKPLRTVTISAFGLRDESDGNQLSFFDAGQTKKTAINGVLDSINDKYGKGTVKRALLLNNDLLMGKQSAEDFLPFKREAVKGTLDIDENNQE